MTVARTSSLFVDDARPDDAVSTGWRRTIVAVLVAIIAQTAALTLLSTDPWKVGLRSASELTSTLALLAFGVLAVSLVGGSIALARSAYLRNLFRQLLHTLTPRPWAVLPLNALLGVAVVRSPLAYPVHLAVTATAMVVTLLALLAAGANAPPRLTQVATTWVAGSRRLRWYASGLVLVVSTLLAITVFHRIPHIPDEVVYLFQAKTLAAGSLSLPELAGGRAWDMIYTIRHDGRWFGIFPPGWPAVLALGVVAGVPWLVNPLLAAAVVLVAHGLTRRVTSLAVANWVALTLATSPWFLFLAASMMSHTLSLLCTAVVLWAVTRLGRRRSAEAGGPDDLPWSAAPLGGGALGVLVLTRPIEGVLLGLTVAVWLVAVAPRAAFGVRGLAMASTAFVTGALYLPYNALLTGRALLDPITLYFDSHFYSGANRLGFGATIGNVGWGNDVFPGHSLLEAMINANLNSHLVQLELFGWGFGSMLVVLAYLGARYRRFDRIDGLLCTLGAAILVTYGAYWYSGADFGPRYWSQLLLPLTILSARGVGVLATRGEQRAAGAEPVRLRHAATWATTLFLASIIGGPLIVATRAAGKYREYRGMTPAIADLARQTEFGTALVLIRGDVFSDYAAGMMLNDARPIDGRPVYARYVAGPELDALRRQFPQRTIWVVDGSSLTGGAPRATKLAGGASAAAH